MCLHHSVGVSALGQYMSCLLVQSDLYVKVHLLGETLMLSTLFIIF